MHVSVFHDRHMKHTLITTHAKGLKKALVSSNLFECPFVLFALHTNSHSRYDRAEGYNAPKIAGWQHAVWLLEPPP